MLPDLTSTKHKDVDKHHVVNMQNAVQAEGSSSSGDSSDDDMDEDMSDAVPAAVSVAAAAAPQQWQEPVVDADGFELVQRRKGRR